MQKLGVECKCAHGVRFTNDLSVGLTIATMFFLETKSVSAEAKSLTSAGKSSSSLLVSLEVFRATCSG